MNVHANVVVGVPAPREGDVTARMEVDDPALGEIEVTAQVDFTAQDGVIAQVEVTAQVDVVRAHVDAEAQFDVQAKVDIDGCSFMYTNIDSYLNKRSEILSIVDKRKPKIIALTEILAKNHKCIHLPEQEYLVMTCLLTRTQRGVLQFIL